VAVETASGLVIRDLAATAYVVPTPTPESDGTFAWSSTTVVVVEAAAGNATGIGYAYTHGGAAAVVDATLAPVVIGRDPLATAACWSAMVDAVRNVGRPGIASSAVSAVDIALWDLKGKLVGLSVADAVGRAHDAIPAYGSGGFTSSSTDELADELSDFVELGLTTVKMKVGRDPDTDVARVAAARRAVGNETGLLVDANGAYSRKQALDLARAFADRDVAWFEEPVSSDDLEGLRLMRDRAPAGMDIAAGEYGADIVYFRRLLDAGAIDCLQADVTRCGGITGFLRVGALADAHCLPLSSHTAPQASAHACAGVWHLRHAEYFIDHVRIESLFFDGVLRPDGGCLRPDPDRCGLGIDFKRNDAERYRT
jgi:L-alanine-DL-glutamate epimerase-like enolase superfamily enzyme